MTYPTRYQRPDSLAEALRLAAEPENLILAGGTLVQPLINEHHLGPRAILDVSAVQELRGISLSDGSIRIGAATTLAEIAGHGEVRRLAPVLVEALETIASHEVRQQATLGGNIEAGSAAMDSLPALLVYDAQVDLASATVGRRLALREHLRAGPQTSRQPGELLVSVEFAPPQGCVGRFLKLGVRKSLAPSVASLAVILGLSSDGTIRELRLACGCYGEQALRLAETEAAARGVNLDSQMIDRLASIAAAEVHPVDDIYASGRYRQSWLQEVLRRVLREIQPDRADVPTVS